MKKKLLLIDDIREFLSMLKLTLSGDYDVETAKNGVEALELLQNGYQPDVIVTDLCMPSMDGYELISRIKESDDFKKIPVIVLSNSERKKDEEKVLKQGAHTFIRKSYVPIEYRTELEHSINSLLKHAS